MRRKGSLLGFIILATLLFGVSTAHAAFPGHNGKLLFGDGFLSIQVVNPDGSGNTVLETTGPNSYLLGPAWSADGRKIVFAQTDDEGGSSSIDVMNADGSGRMTIWPFVAPDHLSWSPDGRWIAYSSDGILRRRYPPDASSPTRITSGNDSLPEWSPDGSKFAFARYVGADGHYEIHTVNATDGSGLVRLTDNPAPDQWPEWSPDSQHIAFTRGSVDSQIYRMNADGSGVIQLTDDPRRSRTPAWSPDGRKIAFLRLNSVSGGDRIWVMNADGSGEQDIGVPASESSLDWQPILHDAPQSADTLHMSLVPMFRQTISSSQCAARGGQTSTHGAPLAFSSCNPPGYLPNTMARLGPGSSSNIDVTALPGNQTTEADEADLAFNVQANDVRARPGGGDYDPSASPDATLSLILRWSDTYNGPALRAPATGSDLTYSVPVSCVATADPSLGSNCSTNTTADALAPGTILEGRRTVITLSRWWLYDSGLNATRGDGDDRMFAQSGIYIP